MKKKGFTLIELLAVIVILAIIALILVPVVSNIVASSRKAAFIQSVGGVIDSAGSHLQDYILKHHEENSVFPVTFTCDGTSCSNGTDTLVFKGTVPVSGNVIIAEDGVMAEYITYGKYCAYGYKWDLLVEKNCAEIDVTKPVITGVKNGKVITLTMTDVGSGVDKYCANTTDTTEGCSWVTPSNPSSEEYTIQEEGTRYFFVRDKKGNISDSINFTTTRNDYCTYVNDQVVEEFSYTGDIQSFTVPSGCSGIYKLEVWGAGPGGKGGYSYGNVSLSGDDIIYVVVGGTPYNGGGGGGSGSGGGATHIGKTENLLKNTAQADVYLVAGGGGSNGGASGGYGGGTNGSTGGADCNSGGGGYGASQTSGGGGRTAQVDSGWNRVGSGSGSYGQGGSGCGSAYQQGGGGGGGGWYGGGGGCAQGGWGRAGGGGGSGWVGGVEGGVTIGGNASMPTHDGTSTMTGNSGNGYAKITFVGPGITIIFDPNGGTVGTTKKVLENNGPIGEMPIPTKSGNDYFYGWYFDREFTEFVSPETVIDKNVTVYARWGRDLEFDFTNAMTGIYISQSRTYKLEVWGAQGGSGGGLGAYASGNVALTAGQYIYVGIGGTNGFNGGGSGPQGAGGGATHIGLTNGEIKNTTQANLFLVAAGGGGGGQTSGVGYGPGGYGGAATGGNGGADCNSGGGGYGASQTNGGGGRSAQVDSNWNKVSSGSGAYGQGGSACGSAYQQGGGGGGGGFYGGGGGCGQGGWGRAGGGGGSSYIGGVISGTMVAGNASMSTHDGTSTMTGNSGNGYAKITLISN